MQHLQNILNPEQFRAATSGDGPLLVLAAAGTGKTQTLVYRVAHLISQGIAPWSILLLTFTNRAANEMLARAQEVVGMSAAKVWGGTFHSVCNRLMQMENHATLLGFEPRFKIADEDDTKKIIAEIIKELRLSKSENFPKKEVLLSIFSNAANRNVPLEESIRRVFPFAESPVSEILKVHECFVKEKRKLGLMDFDDLLVNGLRLLRENPSVLARYRAQFRHILVDEYQDTNAVQSEFVDLLAGEQGNLMAVGDDFQCIYTWRGADFRNIMEFPKRHKNSAIIKLERNYRSSPEILALANACIKCNPDQFQKTLIATRAHGEKPVVFDVANGADQARLVMRLIQNEKFSGRPRSDIAVLYRAHFHSIELQMALTRAGIPYMVTSGVGIFEQAHVRDTLALLRIATDPHDKLAFERLVELLPGVGSRTSASLWKKLGERCELSTCEGREKVLRLLKPPAKNDWDGICAALNAYFGESDTKSHDVTVLISLFMENFYLASLRAKYENWEERAEDISEVALQISTAESLESFLQNVALCTSAETACESDPEKRKSKVRLSTVHQAKGLEWPFVIILWACDGMFPFSRAIEDDEHGEAEERRLFYVAVTRARNRLAICVPQWRSLAGSGVVRCSPSRFITETPPECLTYRNLAMPWQ